MANYPTFPQVMGSERQIVDDVRMDRAVDGTGYSRAFFTAPKDRLILRHVLNQSDWATLLAFYTANRTTAFDVAWQSRAGGTYTGMIFEGPPRASELGAGLFSVEVAMASR